MRGYYAIPVLRQGKIFPQKKEGVKARFMKVPANCEPAGAAAAAWLWLDKSLWRGKLRSGRQAQCSR
jgi:hypothetical protein